MLLHHGLLRHHHLLLLRRVHHLLLMELRLHLLNELRLTLLGLLLLAVFSVIWSRGRWLRHLTGRGRATRPWSLRRQGPLVGWARNAAACARRPTLLLDHDRLRTHSVELRVAGAIPCVLRRAARMTLLPHHRRPGLAALDGHRLAHLAAGKAAWMVHSWPHLLARRGSRRPDEAAHRGPHVRLG